ncbi:MAG: hypothetical protein U0599_26945 [Vicinamibacteria bacterium]
MNVTLLVLRIVHVLGAVFWAGSILFVVDFLQPALRAAGPDGLKVLGPAPPALLRGPAGVRGRHARLRLRPLLPRLRPLHPGPGAGGAEFAYGIGGLASVVAFVIGLGVMRPSVVRLAALAGEWLAAPAERRAALDVEMVVCAPAARWPAASSSSASRSRW